MKINSYINYSVASCLITDTISTNKLSSFPGPEYIVKERLKILKKINKKRRSKQLLRSCLVIEGASFQKTLLRTRPYALQLTVEHKKKKKKIDAIVSYL